MQILNTQNIYFLTGKKSQNSKTVWYQLNPFEITEFYKITD